ncbi:MAG: hypothetical protein FJ384_02160 [Verrucomicrobia bacterium]|nr:hypothetical protein [Verrucomicrobiota bacterium]
MSRAVGQASLWAALAALLLAGCDTPVISSDEVPGIAYVNERRRSAADVARASDVFGAKEDHGADVVFRTDPAAREGHYFYVKLADAPPVDARLVLQVVRTENAVAERYEFPARFRPGFPFGEYVIGLTGKQAGDAKWRPLAWRVSVVDAQGKVLAAKHSFLWGTPRDLGR